MVHEDFDLEDDEADELVREEEEEEVRTETDMEEWLSEAIVNMADEEGRKARVNTFGTVGMLTYNKGLVVTLDGRSFQLTIVRGT